jgi:hypothetical protein
MRTLLFSLTSRLVSSARPFSVVRPVGGTTVPPGPLEDEEMQQVRSFLRAAPSRIGRRLAQIVAIAAASLAAAGA